MPTPTWGLVTPASTDLVSQGDNAIADNANTLDNSSMNVTMLMKSTFAARPTAASAKNGALHLSIDTTPPLLALSDGTNWVQIAGGATAQGVSFIVGGEIRVPVGQVDVIPQLFVPVSAGQVTKIVRCRYSIGAGTSVTFKLTVNGSDAVTGLVATTTPAETDFTDVVVSNNDRLQVVVTAVSGSPTNLSTTVVLEHTV